MAESLAPGVLDLQEADHGATQLARNLDWGIDLTNGHVGMVPRSKCLASAIVMALHGTDSFQNVLDMLNWLCIDDLDALGEGPISGIKLAVAVMRRVQTTEERHTVLAHMAQHFEPWRSQAILDMQLDPVEAGITCWTATVGQYATEPIELHWDSKSFSRDDLSDTLICLDREM